MHQKIGALIDIGESEAYIHSGYQCDQAKNRRSTPKPDGHLLLPTPLAPGAFQVVAGDVVLLAQAGYLVHGLALGGCLQIRF